MKCGKFPFWQIVSLNVWCFLIFDIPSCVISSSMQLYIKLCQIKYCIFKNSYLSLKKSVKSDFINMKEIAKLEDENIR